jgi:sortase A
MKQIKFRIFIVSGLMMLVAAGALLAYNAAVDYIADRRASLLLAQITEFYLVPPSITAKENDAQIFITFDEPPLPNEISAVETPSPAYEPETIMEADEFIPPEAEVLPTPVPPLVYDTAGIINIPSLQLRLPIIKECTDALLKIAPCLYSGTLGEKPEKLIIAGHNYRSHFGRIPQMVLGEEVLFTTLDGVTYRYAVTEITVLSMYDNISFYTREWDLALFTCDTADRTLRVIVFCALIDEIF